VKILSKLLVAFGCMLWLGCEQTRETTQPVSSTSFGEQALDVEPGTELAEVHFKQALRETGAKYVVIQVYAEACGPCMTEALRLTKQQQAWQTLGVAILGMGMDETPAGPQVFYRHTGGRITYPLYWAPWFSEQQKVYATPTLFLYGANGEQLFRADPETAEEGVMVALNAKLSQLLQSTAK